MVVWNSIDSMACSDLTSFSFSQGTGKQKGIKFLEAIKNQIY